MRHTITTTIVNTPTGVPSSSDGVMMLVCRGIAVSGKLVLDTAYLCTKLSDLATLGISPDYDYTNTLNVYQQASEFYAEAGDGAYLWLVVTAATNAFATYCAGATFKGLIAGTISADAQKRVKMIGVSYNPPTTQQSSGDFPADVLAAIPVLQATEVAMAAQGFPFSSILDGENMSSTTTPTTIQTVATKNAPTVSLCITGSRPNGTAAVGAALGRFARITVGHGFGETDDGPISLTSSYLTNGVQVPILGASISQGTNLTAAHSYMVVLGPVTYNGNVYTVGQIFTVILGTLGFTGVGTTVIDLITAGTIVAATQYIVLFGPVTSNGIVYGTGQVFTATATSFTGGIVSLFLGTQTSKLYQADFNALGDSQYMFHGPYYQLPGLYWNDGATCDLSINPLSTQEFNRVGNKEVSALLNFLALLKGKNVPVDKKTGLVSLSFTSTKQQDFFSSYINPLIVSGDITGGSLALIGTPNGTSTVNWIYVLTINGMPITGSATGTVTFSNT